MTEHRSVTLINMKTCSRCKQDKPNINKEFNIDSRYRDGFHSVCRKCRSYVSVTSYIKKVYGLSRAEYEVLIAKNPNCQSCGDLLQRPVLDHDHKTGKIRGVLCNNCNTALGLLKDDVLRIEKLKQYSLTYTN